MKTKSTEFDKYLSPDGPAALVIREYLMPVEGQDAVVFPPTFADIGYNIDYEDAKDKSGHNIALIDSIGSQANRIEPMFANAEYRELVPQIIIKAGEKDINLLDVGHRAGDALVRCSGLQEELHGAFLDVIKGNALPLAKIAPTSLLFGVWDSRDTQAKLPRLISSTIRAYDVRKLTRSATYFPPVDYTVEEIFTEAEKQKAEGDAKNPLSKRGFVNALATSTHGGIIAENGIRRDAVLALAALKLLKAGNEDDTLKLQRYILGLALTAFTKLPLGYYRQGTILVLDPQKEQEFFQVNLQGKKEPCTLTHNDALEFARQAAKNFGVEKNREVYFDKTLAKKDITATGRLRMLSSRSAHNQQ